MFGFLVTAERRLPGLIDAVRAGFDSSEPCACRFGRPMFGPTVATARVKPR
jgi:hypothetical protein